MQITTIYILLSVLAVSLVSLVGIFPLLRKKKMSESTLLILVSLSAGTLFGGAFFHLIPEGIEFGGLTLGTMLSLVSGIVVFFILEKFIHWHHHSDHHHPSKAHKQMHGHAYHLAPLNLIGDGVHNFLDGIVIAISYLVNIPLGIAATVSVVLHEVPQEIADFGVLLYAGLSKKKALIFNFLSAVTAVFGAIFGIVVSSKLPWFNGFALPFAAGNFIYIAGSNLVPELHKHCKIKESVFHLISFLIGIAIMIGLLFIGGHTHG